jgi:hypothetical protein
MADKRIIVLRTGEAVLADAIVSVRLREPYAGLGLNIPLGVLVDVGPHCIGVPCTDVADQKSVLDSVVSAWQDSRRVVSPSNTPEGGVPCV